MNVEHSEIVFEALKDGCYGHHLRIIESKFSEFGVAGMMLLGRSSAVLQMIPEISANRSMKGVAGSWVIAAKRVEKVIVRLVDILNNDNVQNREEAVHNLLSRIEMVLKKRSVKLTA